MKKQQKSRDEEDNVVKSIEPHSVIAFVLSILFLEAHSQLEKNLDQ